jgi:ABC-type lipoprotein export system ATPase subunit
MSRVLTVEGLTKVYRMGEIDVPALRGIDLVIQRGELTVLLGPSGSGKSTLLNILGGLDVPTSGRVLYHDRDLTAASERALTSYRRDHVGFVFQFNNLVPSLTARENVALVTDVAEHPVTPDHALQKAEEVIASDELLDALYFKIFNELLVSMIEDPVCDRPHLRRQAPGAVRRPCHQPWRR